MPPITKTNAELNNELNNFILKSMSDMTVGDVKNLFSALDNAEKQVRDKYKGIKGTDYKKVLNPGRSSLYGLSESVKEFRNQMPDTTTSEGYHQVPSFLKSIRTAIADYFNFIRFKEVIGAEMTAFGVDPNVADTSGQKRPFNREEYDYMKSKMGSTKSMIDFINNLGTDKSLGKDVAESVLGHVKLTSDGVKIEESEPDKRSDFEDSMERDRLEAEQRKAEAEKLEAERRAEEQKRRAEESRLTPEQKKARQEAAEAYKGLAEAGRNSSLGPKRNAIAQAAEILGKYAKDPEFKPSRFEAAKLVTGLIVANEPDGDVAEGVERDANDVIFKFNNSQTLKNVVDEFEKGNPEPFREIIRTRGDSFIQDVVREASPEPEVQKTNSEPEPVQESAPKAEQPRPAQAQQPKPAAAKPSNKIMSTAEIGANLRKMNFDYDLSRTDDDGLNINVTTMTAKEFIDAYGGNAKNSIQKSLESFGRDLRNPVAAKCESSPEVNSKDLGYVLTGKVALDMLANEIANKTGREGPLESFYLKNCSRETNPQKALKTFIDEVSKLDTLQPLLNSPPEIASAYFKGGMEYVTKSAMNELKFKLEMGEPVGRIGAKPPQKQSAQQGGRAL